MNPWAEKKVQFLLFCEFCWSLKQTFLCLYPSTGCSQHSQKQNSSTKTSRDSGQGHFSLNQRVLAHYATPYPENKMLPDAWLKEQPLSVLYFHQTCPYVAPCVIAISFSCRLTTVQCLIFADEKGHITATSSVWSPHSAAPSHSVYSLFSVESPGKLAKLDRK